MTLIFATALGAPFAASTLRVAAGTLLTSPEPRRTDAPQRSEKRQARPPVRTHQSVGEEAGSQHQTRQRDRRADGEQTAARGGSDKEHVAQTR